jgi:hypothetical protein
METAPFGCSSGPSGNKFQYSVVIPNSRAPFALLKGGLYGRKI